MGKAFQISKMMLENLKKYRKDRGFTQKQLAEKVHKSEISIRKYENGDSPIPIQVLFDLIKALDITPFELVGETKLDESFDFKEFEKEFYEKYPLKIEKKYIPIKSEKSIINKICTNKDLCSALKANPKQVSKNLDLNSNITIDSLQILCKYLGLDEEEEAFLYAMYVYKTDNDLFRILAFYYYLLDEYSNDLYYPNDEFLLVGNKLNEKYGLSNSLGYALGKYNKDVVSRIISNSNPDNNIYKNIIDLLYDLDSSYIFPLKKLSLEDTYNICAKLSETLKYELYKKSLNNTEYKAEFYEYEEDEK